MLPRIVQFSDEERPCRTRAVDLVKDGRTGSEHPVRVAWDRSRVEGESAHAASEFAPKFRTDCPARTARLGRQGDGARCQRKRELEVDGMMRVALLVLGTSLAAGCAPDGPLGSVGAIVTAPVTAPVMFVSARMNDREDHLESARHNDRPLPPIDARSSAMAQGDPRAGPRTAYGRRAALLAEPHRRGRLCRGWDHHARDRADEGWAY